MSEEKRTSGSFEYGSESVSYYRSGEKNEGKAPIFRWDFDFGDRVNPGLDGEKAAHIKEGLGWLYINRASQNVSSLKGEARVKAQFAEAKRLADEWTLEKESAGRAYVDAKFVQALMDAGICESRADASATFEKNVTAAGFRTKAEVAQRVEAFCEKHPSIGEAYEALQEGEAGAAIDL